MFTLTDPNGRWLRYLVAAVVVLGGALAVPAAPANAHAPAGLGTVPDAAFLRLGDGGSRPDAELRPYLRPPRPGGTAGYPSLSLRRAEGTVSFLFGIGENQPPTVLLEYLATFHGAGAQRYLHQIRRALGSGAGLTDHDGVWTVLARRVAGPDSLLIRLRQNAENPVGDPIVQDTYLVVARSGRTVLVLADIGWEDGSGHPAIVTRLAPLALRRAAQRMQ
jgi:hypothetical protein